MIDASVCFYHAVCNGYDKPKPVKDVGAHATYTCIVGVTRPERAALWNRSYKIISPPQMDDFSVYMDGNISPAISTLQLRNWIYQELTDADIAICRHAVRKCAYVELEACVSRKKITAEQASVAHEYLSKRGLPKGFGLWECGIIFRRARVAWLEELQCRWLAHIYNTGVCRDQLFLPLTLWELRDKFPAGRFKTLDYDVRNNPMFSFTSHL